MQIASVETEGRHRDLRRAVEDRLRQFLSLGRRSPVDVLDLDRSRRHQEIPTASAKPPSRHHVERLARSAREG